MNEIYTIVSIYIKTETIKPYTLTIDFKDQYILKRR